ncbi:MAG: hypothetical protein ACTTIC_05950 [Helicobacteraceae bacterium]
MKILAKRALETIRRIHDFSSTPVVLAGTFILLNNLQGKNKELKQLYNRISGKWAFKGLSKEESNNFFCAGLYDYARGNFRVSAKLFKKAGTLASSHKCAIDADVLQTASEMIIL